MRTFAYLCPALGDNGLDLDRFAFGRVCDLGFLYTPIFFVRKVVYWINYEKMSRVCTTHDSILKRELSLDMNTRTLLYRRGWFA